MNFKTQTILALPIFIVTTMLASCSTPAPAPAPTPAPYTVAADNTSCSLRLSDHLASNEVVRYYAFLTSLNEANLSNEYQTTRAHFSASNSISDRLKLVVLLTIPNTSFHNPEEAIDLLKSRPVETTNNPTDLSGFSNLLDMLLTQQQQADEQLTGLKKSLAEEKLHSKLLQEKIDAVKSMEIKMIQRDQP